MWQDLCFLYWLKAPVADWYDVGRDAKTPILLAGQPVGMDDLRPNKPPWEDVVLIQDMLGERCLDPGCRHCLSQMAFPAVART